MGSKAITVSRLVYIASYIEPAKTGGERYNLHLITAAELAGIRVVRLVLSENPAYRWFNQVRGLWRLCRPFAFFWLHWKMWRHRREVQLFDVWLAPLLWPGIARLNGRYLVVVHHLRAELREGWHKWWEEFCETQLLSGALRVLTVSQSSRRQVERRVHNVPIDIINTAFEPIDGLTTGGGDILRILYVGHIMRVKGVIDLAEAVAGLSREGNWRLDMVGRDRVEPGTTERIRSICRGAGISERVSLHGWLGADDLLGLYLSSDIFVLPSYWEGYGIVLLEAMSHRLAVISTTAGAIPEVVQDGETGLLVPAGDVEALRAALRRLMEDATLRERLAGNGLGFARQHPDWNDMQAQCVEWWKSLADNGQATGSAGLR